MKPVLLSMIAVFFACCGAATAEEQMATDLLDFSAGAVPVAYGANPEALKVGFEQALSAIDGSNGKIVITPKPGDGNAEVWFVYKLPAETVFSGFAVPNVGETPSAYQTFFRDVTIEGSLESAEGPFVPLAAATLSTHTEPDEVTQIAASQEAPVRWVKLTLKGGINVEVDKTFYEFSEIIGAGTQDSVPMLETFTGKWKGRGVKLEMKQSGPSVVGCYDGVGDLKGSVTGNLLRASGTDRKSGVMSSFILTVNDAGQVSGLRSTNGAPFKWYGGDTDAKLVTECSDVPEINYPGCGDIIYGIQFGFDSADIRPESAPVLDALFQGLESAPEGAITIVGHTSSEGSDEYNSALSERRAQSVVNALQDRGIAAARLSASGQGEAEPVADNATEAGRSLNRRVEIECAA